MRIARVLATLALAGLSLGSVVAPAAAAVQDAAVAPAGTVSHTSTAQAAGSAAGEHAASGSALTAPLPASTQVTDVTVEDTSGRVNEERLRSYLLSLRFHQPTKVAVYARSGEYSDNQNAVTRQYAKSKHPEWISGDYWADGMFIISLTIEDDGHGQIGTYFGEDRKVSDSTMEKIQQAGYDDFKKQRWTDGLDAVASSGAKYINRPWYLNPVGWIAGLIAAVVGLGAWFATVQVRAGRRRNFAQALDTGTRHLAQVSTDLDSTEIAARTLPTGSRYAADLEHRFADFMQRYRTAFGEQQELELADKKVRATPAAVRRATDFATTATDLDFTDDAIVQAAALYTRTSTWREAWQAQTAPLVEDLQQIPDASSLGADPGAVALASFKAQALTSVQNLDTQMESQQISVDDALDQLANLRKELTSRLDAYAQERINSYARSDEERAQMQGELERARYEASTQRSGRGSILDVTSPANLFWRMAAFNVGYSHAQTQVDHSRQQAEARSSGGISHGYGGGGGSFSGSGGSSRF